MIPSNTKALIIDMDGVIWKADTPIGDLESTFKRIRERGLKFVFATNNSTKTTEQYVAQMAKFGVEVEPWQIITSSQAAAHAVAQKFPAGIKVFMIGEDGIRLALEEKGFEVVSTENASSAEVFVMGIDREINFDKVAEATLLVRNGIPFYGTNTDKTFPTPRGEIPGSGAWLSIITTATGVEPIIAGKPYPYLMDLSLEKLGVNKEEALVVGDRLEKDIAAGQKAGIPCALVLSGVSTQEEADAWELKIDVIAKSLSELVN
jgi:4-nitrophenyl phosphatase